MSRAKRALASGIFPQDTLDLIEDDMLTTLPAIHIFHKETGPLYSDLKDMLCAWVVSRSDEGLGYTVGAAKIAAMLLINMPSQQGFIVMRNLLERHCLRSFFGGERAKDDVSSSLPLTTEKILSDFSFRWRHIIGRPGQMHGGSKLTLSQEYSIPCSPMGCRRVSA